MVVEVIPISGLNKILAYKAPPQFRDSLKIGSLVSVPLRNRKELGIIAGFGTDQKIPTSKLKQVIEVVQPHPVLSPDLMQLFRWAQHYYSASAETILETIIPAAIRKGMQPKTSRYLSICKMPVDTDWQRLEKSAPKQAALLKYVQRHSKPVARADALKALKITGSVCDRLVEKGFLHDEATEEARIAYQDALGKTEIALETTTHQLTSEQSKCLDSIRGSLSQKNFNVHLLHGVTGSGKTEVYLRAIERVVSEKGSVIFLVPEVASVLFIDDNWKVSRTQKPDIIPLILL